jgi:pimeloyl-ACP methyl ester carboxylesterase
MGTMHAETGRLTLFPYVVKTDLAGPDSERYRIGTELGRLLVPERRSNPDSRLIELAFVRMKSTSQQPGPPLVFLAGGPGISGIDALRMETLYPWFAALRQVGDVIALDQRGTGLSNPRLDCLESWDLPLDRPASCEEVLQVGREKARNCVDFWRQQGVDLTGYTTVESADDIEDLRKALGYDTLNLYGASYGSHLALATIRRHGAHISRAIIAMVEGLDHTLKLPSSIQQHMEQLNALVKADSYWQSRIPDLPELMQSVLERLEREPVTATVTDRRSKEQVQICVGKFDLQWLTTRDLCTQSFIAKLPTRYYAMAQGDFSWLGTRMLSYRRERIGNAMSYMMDGASGVSPERYARIQREAPQTLFGDLINFPFPDIAAAWESPDLGPAFRAPFTSGVPALFLSGTLDARTPVSNAEEVRAGFPHSQHIIVEGATHSTPEIVQAPGITDAMLNFLRGQAITLTQSVIPFTFIHGTER